MVLPDPGPGAKGQPPLIFFYGIAVAIILGGGATVFLLLRRRSLPVSIGSTLATMGVLVLIWPLPIHGGFMFLGEAMFHEWSRNRDRARQLDVQDRKRAFVRDLGHRFRGELAIRERVSLGDGWSSVELQAGASGWLDEASGLIWSAWLSLPVGAPLPPLGVAKRRCAELLPSGFWALATEAENAISWLHGGDAVLPDPPTGSVSYSIDADHQLETPTYALRGGSNSGRDPTEPRVFSVRCVARGPGAPERGFFRQDLPLSEWNRYQLSKSAR